MSTTQAARMARRERERQIRRERTIETVKGIVFIALLLFAFAVAGTVDRADEQRELAYWADRGIEVQRW